MKQTAIVSSIALFVDSFEKVELWLRVAALIVPLIVGTIQALRRPPRRENRKPQRVQSVLPLVGLVLVVCCAGCTSVGTANLVRALGQDTNAVSVSVRSPWGTVDIKRN